VRQIFGFLAVAAEVAGLHLWLTITVKTSCWQQALPSLGMSRLFFEGM